MWIVFFFFLHFFFWTMRANLEEGKVAFYFGGTSSFSKGEGERGGK